MSENAVGIPQTGITALILYTEAKSHEKPEGRIIMRKRLRLTLSLLCVLALLLTCVTTAAVAQENNEQTESHIVYLEWSDDNNAGNTRPSSIDAGYGGKTVELSGPEWTGEVMTAAGTTDSWSLSFENNGYTVTPFSEEKGITRIKLSRQPVTTVSKTAEVSWKDGENARGIRPESVHLMLLADDEPCGEPKIVKYPWKVRTVTWGGLRATKPGSDQAIVYSVKQLESVPGYTTTYDGLKVTNTLQTGTLSLKATLTGAPDGTDLSRLKLVIDGPDPSMPVNLTYGQISGGSFSFGTVLPGAYLVRETNADTLAEGYTMDAANSKVTDAVYVPAGESAALEFKYAWKLPEPLDEEADEDYDPLAGIGALTFEILGPDSRMPMTITYADFKNGKYELPDLEPGVYTVVERNTETLVKYYTLTSASVAGMAVEVKPDGTATAKLYNQYVPAPTPEPDAEFVDIPVTKTWNDNNNADGNRPNSVTARLYADGVEVDSHVLTAAENWHFTFVEKPRYQEDNRTEIVYTVGEDTVAMYAATINGFNIVNNYQPEVTSVSVSKVWDDNGNEQKIRPESIAMSLSDGQKVVKVVVLNSDNGWSATVNNLPTVVNGQPAQYAWQEQSVLGYELEGVVQEGSHMTFTNKVWERPENPTAGRKPKTRGETWYIFEDYDTPLGVSVVINHVGDCFD